MPTPRLMVVLFVATGVVVAAVLALTLQSWWVLAGVVALHAIATTFVVGYALRRTLEAAPRPQGTRSALSFGSAPARKSRAQELALGH